MSVAAHGQSALQPPFGKPYWRAARSRTRNIRVSSAVTCCNCHMLLSPAALQANREAPTLRFTAARGEVANAAASAASLVDGFSPDAADAEGLEAQVAALLGAAGGAGAAAMEEAEQALAEKVRLWITGVIITGVIITVPCANASPAAVVNRFHYQHVGSLPIQPQQATCVVATNVCGGASKQQGV